MLFARKKSAILAAILITASAQAGAFPVLQNRDSFGTIQDSLSEKTDIIVFGDTDHGSQEIKQMFFHYVEQLHQADKSFECVFVEDSRKFQQSVDEFLNGNSFEDTIVRSQKELLPKGHYERIVRKTFFNQSFLEYLRENHFKLFPYDVSFENHFDRLLHLQLKLLHGFGTQDDRFELMDFLLVHRNEAMAEKIQESITQHECQKSIIMVGALHMDKKRLVNTLKPFLPHEKIKSLGDHMNELELPHQYYILSDKPQ